MRPLPTEAVQGAVKAALGIAIIRGEPIPVVDLGALFGERAGEPTRFVTVRAGGVIALAVEAVIGIRRLPRETLQALPPLLADAATGAIAAIAARDQELVLLLHSTHLVPDDVAAGALA